MKYLLGCDIGTSGTKTIIMDITGNLIAQDLQEYDVLVPKNLWAEQDADVWVSAMEKSIKLAIQKSGIDAKNIAAASISGLYGGSGVPVDENMKPVRPCIIWMDRRAREQQKWVESKIGKQMLRDISKSGTDPYYGYLKMLWIKDNEKENWDKTKLFLPPNAYAIYKLTGEVAIDYSSAGNIGGVFDMRTRSWSTELLNLLGIEQEKMPSRIVNSEDIVGYVTTEASKRTGLSEGTPICAGGVDCTVATLGMGILEEGVYSTTIGTSMCASFVHKEELKANDLIEFPYVRNGKEWNYSFGGAATAGAIIKWFKEELSPYMNKDGEIRKSSYNDLDKLAEEVDAGSEGIVVLPYFMGERSPLWDPSAKGVIFGLSMKHTNAHLYRAFLESVAYALRDSVESTNTDIGDTIIVSGGVANSVLWTQILADITGKKIRCPKENVEATLGDVMLAGIGSKTLTWAEVKEWSILGDAVVPNLDNKVVYDKQYKIYKKLYDNLKELMSEIEEEI